MKKIILFSTLALTSFLSNSFAMNANLDDEVVEFTPYSISSNGSVYFCSDNGCDFVPVTQSPGQPSDNLQSFLRATITSRNLFPTQPSQEEEPKKPFKEVTNKHFKKYFENNSWGEDSSRAEHLGALTGQENVNPDSDRRITRGTTFYIAEGSAIPIGRNISLSERLFSSQ